MPVRRKIFVRLHYRRAEPTSGEAEIEEFTRRERVARAARGLGLAWLAGLLFLFVPVANLVLTPILLAGGVSMAWLALSSATRPVTARGECPRCRKAATFRVVGILRGGRSLECGECRAEVKIVANAGRR